MQIKNHKRNNIGMLDVEVAWTTHRKCARRFLNGPLWACVNFVGYLDPLLEIAKAR